GVPEGTKPRNVERVAIIGAGTMGGGIAMSFANAGIPVTLIETGEEQLKRGMGVMQKNYEATAARGGIPADAPAKRMGLINGVVGVCDGFVGNRMLAQRGKQSEKLLFEGALPQQVDAVVTKFGMPMGPFAMSDLAGLDIGWRSRKDRGIKSEIADALCEAGRF